MFKFSWIVICPTRECWLKSSTMHFNYYDMFATATDGIWVHSQFFKRDVSYYIQVICICIIQLSFFFEHRYDVIKATEVLIQVSAEIMTISKVAFFFYNRKHALEIIENLQSNFNESKNVPYI